MTVLEIHPTEKKNDTYYTNAKEVNWHVAYSKWQLKRAWESRYNK